MTEMHAIELSGPISSIIKLLFVRIQASCKVGNDGSITNFCYCVVVAYTHNLTHIDVRDNGDILVLITLSDTQ